MLRTMWPSHPDGSAPVRGAGSLLGGHGLRPLKQQGRSAGARATEADNDTLTKRLRVGAQLLPPLQKAKMTLEPFFLRDPNMLGEILTEIGLIHLQLFQDFDEAEKTLKEAKKLDDFLDRNIVISANDEHEVCGHALSAR